MRQIVRYVDTVNLMTYDRYGSQLHTGHHAPLYGDPNDPRNASSDKSVRAYLTIGVPRNKLVLGTPFYGKGWKNVPARYSAVLSARLDCGPCVWQIRLVLEV